jgi:hypothetical protein
MPAKSNSDNTSRDSTAVEKAEKLPHERDESPESGAPRRDVMRQAESDLGEGQIDTDNYTRIREVAPSAGDGRRRRRLP